MKKYTVDFQTTKKERVSYPLFSFGQNVVYLLVAGYLALYCTNFLFIPAYTVSAIFLIAKVWDAVNDPLFGLIVDKVQFKRNKFKPWLWCALVLVPVTTIILFNIPADLPLTARVILLTAAYFLWDMSYTVSDVPVFSLVTAVTDNVQERSSLLSYGSVATVVCAVLFSVVFVPQIETIGFGPLSLIVAALSFLGMLPFIIFSRERNREAMKDAGKTEEKSSLKEIASYLKGNKFLWLFYAWFVGSGVLNVGTTLGSYIYLYCLGSLKYQALFTILGVGPMILIYLLMPKLMARFDRMKLYRISTFCSLFLGLVLFFVGYHSIVLFGIITIIRTIIATPAVMLSFSFTMDCVEYGHYKTGIRKEGMTFAVQTFANKFNAAIAGSLGMLVLGMTGYDPVQKVQTAHTLSSLWMAYCLVPVAGIVLMLPLLMKYKLKSKDVQVMADINCGKLSREEGDQMLSATY